MPSELIGRMPGPRGTILRAMRDTDLPRIMRIERASYTHPWTEGVFRDCLRVGYICRVLEDVRLIKAYGLMSVGAGECHMLNICVGPPYQHQGFGRAVVEHLLEIAAQLEIKTALLEVRVSNRIAYDLYLKLGFNEIGTRTSYYPALKGREDAIILARDL
jgi:ribosomal-protein-alanine N-acetyltransferase